MSPATAAFDGLAAEYDASFTNSRIGRILREAVWRRLDARFGPSDHVLELGCGTAEDAVHLAARGVRVLATDGAPAMVEMARRKMHAHDLADRIELQVMAIESFAERAGQGVEAVARAAPFDGALSNFGALNCIADLAPVAEALAGVLRPRAAVVLVLMGPLCPWEWGWFLADGRPAGAVRRLHARGTRWRGTTVRYPSIRTARRAFAPWFRPLRASALGALVPPPQAGAWAERHDALVRRLATWERRLEATFPLPWLADHYVLELERR